MLVNVMLRKESVSCFLFKISTNTLCPNYYGRAKTSLFPIFLCSFTKKGLHCSCFAVEFVKFFRIVTEAHPKLILPSKMEHFAKTVKTAKSR